MAVDTSAPAPQASAEDQAGREPPPRELNRFQELLRRPARLWHYFGIPTVVVIALVTAWLYVNAAELSSREARTLNADFLVAEGFRHVRLGLVIVFFVIAIAVPLGVILTRPFARRLTPGFIAVANAGQAIPSIGLLVLLTLLMGRGERTAIIGVVAYCILPVLRNTMVGIQQVDQNIIEAGRGMGMTKRAVLWRIELPLSIPIMLAGVRTALILAIGTVTLAALIGAGTLGRVINAGLVGFSNPVLITGAVLTASLALMVDWLGGIAEDLLRPKGL